MLVFRVILSPSPFPFRRHLHVLFVQSILSASKGGTPCAVQNLQLNQTSCLQICADPRPAVPSQLQSILCKDHVPSGRGWCWLISLLIDQQAESERVRRSSQLDSHDMSCRSCWRGKIEWGHASPGSMELNSPGPLPKCFPSPAQETVTAYISSDGRLP